MHSISREFPAQLFPFDPSSQRRHLKGVDHQSHGDAPAERKVPRRDRHNLRREKLQGHRGLQRPLHLRVGRAGHQKGRQSSFIISARALGKKYVQIGVRWSKGDTFAQDMFDRVHYFEIKTLAETCQRQTSIEAVEMRRRRWHESRSQSSVARDVNLPRHRVRPRFGFCTASVNRRTSFRDHP